MPLALDHAAAFCKRTHRGFAAYAANASTLIAAAPRGAPYPRSVAATFDLAIDDAVAQCPAAEALMAFLAYCAPERIPFILLLQGAIDDESERMAALLALAELSLVKHDPFEDGTGAVTVHRLVQAVARARSEMKGFALGAVTAPDRAVRGNLSGRWLHQPRLMGTLCAQLTPHLLASCENGSG